ncbi:uncharacterized protein LOC110729198 [Chenopodium quinoa]|uniref:uncharacterized protein LOC110729198 n=1 Tax=Chenopodium quinoa TaxID=63459 RepID=UPI000B783DE8|nr:uncharacterized protein LOC110729198 [Chenopodium quinoa]
MAGGRRGGRGGRRGGRGSQSGGRGSQFDEYTPNSGRGAQTGGRGAQSGGGGAQSGGHAKVCQKVDDAVYRDNTLSEGGKMKQLGKVIERSKEERTRPENVNCRVEMFGMILNDFCYKKRKLVKEMGFAGLFGLIDRRLPRELAYWLGTRVDVPNNCLVTPDGLEFTFDPIQVHLVLGIPMGSLLVPKDVVTEQMKNFVKVVVTQFSTTTPSNVQGIPRKNLVEAVSGPLENVDEFKVAFLLLAWWMFYVLQHLIGFVLSL